MKFFGEKHENKKSVDKKKIKIYIVTYKRTDVLNNTLENLFKSDFTEVENTEVNIINNHTNFNLDKKFINKVNILNNVLRPDWSNGNLAENWNQALLNGFRDLNNPDAEYIVTMQNDTVVDKNWCKNLLTMHKKFNFIVGKYGDNIVSYTPDAVKKIGIWDENFLGVQYKEADYWIRALIFNKEKSCINDILHGLELNNKDALPLDITEGRNFEIEKNLKEKLLGGDGVLKRRADDDEHKEIWNTRGGIYKTNAWNYFKYKWSGTWKEEPEKIGWIKNWPKNFIDNPPDISKSNIKIFYRYFYFEKNIDDLEKKGYFV
tara:strand:+ start:155 stop:1108 length:954 start_codon:yes stop_codon:yes gene_type:complete